MKNVEKILKNYLLCPNPDFKKISNYILKVIKKNTDSPYGFVGYIDEKTGNLIVPTLTYDVWNECKIQNKDIVFNKFDNLFGWVIKNKKSILSNDVSKNRRATGTPKGHIKIEKFLASPAIIKGKVAGMLAVANKRSFYSDNDLKYLEYIAYIYAIIIYHLIRVKKIEESYKSINELIEKARDIIYVVNKDGIIESINKRAEDYGYKKEDIIGHSTFEFAHPDDREMLKKAFMKAIRTGKTSNVLQYRILKKNGEYFEADQKSSIIFHKKKPLKIIGMIRDMTFERNLQKQLQENKELLEKIFNSSTDAIFVKDLSGNYLKVNKACARIYKYPQDKIIGKNEKDFLDEKVLENIREIDKKVIEGKIVSSIYEMTIKGKKYIFNTIKTPLKDENGNVKFILGIARDITEIRKLEREMFLIKAAENIKKITSQVSHDINNVLSVISGYATLIEETMCADKNIKSETQIIKKSVSKILNIISKFKKKAPIIINKG